MVQWLAVVQSWFSGYNQGSISAVHSVAGPRNTLHQAKLVFMPAGDFDKLMLQYNSHENKTHSEFTAYSTAQKVLDKNYVCMLQEVHKVVCKNFHTLFL